MKFKKIGVIAINGRNWKYGYGNTGTIDGKKNDGLCVYETRTIFINPQSTRSLEDVICHEALHARFPDLSEESVDDAAGIMGEMIIKFKVFLA